MTARGEQLLLVLAPVMAMAAVALGLEVGAGSRVRAAVVEAAPASGAGTGLAWQIATFDEDHGTREATSLPSVDVWARASASEAHWTGPTNQDGVAEVLLGLPGVRGFTLEIRAGDTLLARGEVNLPPLRPRSALASSWARFARREGPITLDVAVLGQRGASGFPASLWIHATDEATHAPLPGVSIEMESDPGLSASTVDRVTDARGWARLVVTPMGYAIPLILHARTSDQRTGNWAGGLFISPGAAQLRLRDRYAPDDEAVVEVTAPNVRTTSYVEVDDVLGRAFAAEVPLIAPEGELPRGTLKIPRLSPGLYWAVASGDPAGAAQLGAGTTVRPFFVAACDEAALAFGTDREACAAPVDPRDRARVVGPCLALAGAMPVPRWLALDGFTAQHAHDVRRHSAGLAVALGAILAAVLLESALLLRSSHRARSRLRLAFGAEAADAGTTGRRSTRRSRADVAVALLVALLGFALLAAFLVRAG